MTDSTGGRGGRLFRVTVIATLLLVCSVAPLPTRYNPDFGLYGPDKFLHFLGHAGLAAALVDAFRDTGRSGHVTVIAVVLSTGYGIGTELLQKGVPGREFERGDVIAGFVGSLVGGLHGRLPSYRRQENRSGHSEPDRRIGP